MTLGCRTQSPGALTLRWHRTKTGRVDEDMTMKIHARSTMVAALTVLGFVASTTLPPRRSRWRASGGFAATTRTWASRKMVCGTAGIIRRKDQIRLPGTTDEAKAGLPNPKTAHARRSVPTERLHRRGLVSTRRGDSRGVARQTVDVAVGTRSLGVAGVARRPADRRRRRTAWLRRTCTTWV